MVQNVHLVHFVIAVNSIYVRDHLQEHDHLLNAQLEPLVDNINELSDRLQQFNLDSVFQPIRLQLDQWKQTAFQSIERFYEQKSNEINQLIDKQVNNLRQQTEQNTTNYCSTYSSARRNERTN